MTIRRAPGGVALRRLLENWNHPTQGNLGPGVNREGAKMHRQQWPGLRSLDSRARKVDPHKPSSRIRRRRGIA